MKRLYLLRHAKAEPAEPGQDDHARALTVRGMHDAGAMARYLRKNGAKLDLRADLDIGAHHPDRRSGAA